jgi:hypothetical protein
MKCRLIDSGSPFPIAVAPDGRWLASPSPFGLRLQDLATEGRTVDLALHPTYCQLVWSGPTTLWLKDWVTLLWTEIDILSRRATGRTAPGGGSCLNGAPDPITPPGVRTPIRIETTIESEIRLRPRGEN